MRKMFKVGSVWMLGAAIVAVMFAASTKQAEARPPYLKAFVTTYPDLKDAAKTAKCGVCHPVKDKKKRNNYGMALGKALGKKNEKIAAKQAEALKKIEKEKSATEGKTYGDLIKDGKLPGKND